MPPATSPYCSRLATKPGVSRRSTIGALPSASIQLAERLDDVRVGALARHDLDQRHELRRIEPVEAGEAVGSLERGREEAIESDDVFVARMAPGAARRSATASRSDLRPEVLRDRLDDELRSAEAVFEPSS